MVRIPRSRQAEIRSLLSTDVLYIALGDQFDDDRRVVRALASARHGKINKLYVSRKEILASLLDVGHDRRSK